MNALSIFLAALIIVISTLAAYQKGEHNGYINSIACTPTAPGTVAIIQYNGNCTIMPQKYLGAMYTPL